MYKKLSVLTLTFDYTPIFNFCQTKKFIFGLNKAYYFKIP